MGSYESGGRAAAPIFLYYMREALKDEPVKEFSYPEQGVTIVNSGAHQICYVEGTVGKGRSEVAPAKEDEFLKAEIGDKEL
jgi:membrane carboxypeptidase/penicillin-binding protein